MATVWITYAWADNTNRDVDFIAQELEQAGLTVKLDRWNIPAGGRLWSHIDEFITSSAGCDAWLLIATQASLGSKPCREEYDYALDRALNSRGKEFPVIALFLASVDSALIPAGIRTRLHVSIRDPDWKERICAAAEGRDAAIAKLHMDPYEIVCRPLDGNSGGCVFEVRPRAGTWLPFIAAAPADEMDALSIVPLPGPRGGMPTIAGAIGIDDGVENGWAYRTAHVEATPSMSYYVTCQRIPTRFLFGAVPQPQYLIDSNAMAELLKRSGIKR